MALREKFGRLVLLEETDRGPLGNEYRAARLGPAGFDRLVTVLRFSQRVSADAEATKRLVEEAKVAAQIHSPGLVKMLGVGRVGSSYYLSTELVEGRTVAAVLAECRDGGFPFGPDHALMIASRAAAGLEALHGKKDDAGRPLLHGLIAPRHLVVAFDGEVKVKGLGLWSALGGTELLAPEERAYLAPEQATVRGDQRSDVYALGLVLLETLTGQGPDGGDAAQRIGSAKMTPPGGEPGPLPKPLADVLRRALAADPAARYPGMAEMRRGIDALLFSGDFTPTTFDLAFFMHTLFREAVDADARAVEEARAADYREFLTDDAARPAATGSPQTEPVEAQPQTAVPEAPAVATTEVLPPTVPDPAPRPAAQAPPAKAPAGPDASHPRLPGARASREPGARDSVSRSGVGVAPAAAAGAAKRQPGRPVLWIGLGVAAALALAAGAWLYLARQRPASPPQPTAEQIAAEARVRELEARIAQLEAEKAAAEARAAEEARQAVEQQAAAGGQTADPAAIERAQEEARRRVRLEQERQQQEELQRIADEKRAEEQRIAAALATAAAVSAAATPMPGPMATPTPVPAELVQPPPTLAPQLRANPDTGALAPSTQATPGVPVAAASPSTARRAPAAPGVPAVRPPALLCEDPVPYPRRAAALRLSTTVTVVVRALIDETGRVTETSISQGSGHPAEIGFDEAALRRVRSRKYRPARRDDVPVPIWVIIRVEFRPPPVR